MKKKSITANLLLLVIFASNAQKQSVGTITSEVGLSLSGIAISSYGLNGRYFISSKIAAVLGVSASSFNSKINLYENADMTGGKGTYEFLNSSRIVSLGAQYFFRGTERLSPFVGANVGIGGTTTKREGINATPGFYRQDYTENLLQKGKILNMNLVLGFDYWLKSGIYFGISYFPIARNYTKTADATLKTVWNGVPNNQYFRGGTSTQITTFNATGTVRLGWRFN